MNFQEWLFEVVHLQSLKTGKDEQEIYCSIDLFDAKLQFLDNINPTDFQF